MSEKQQFRKSSVIFLNFKSFISKFSIFIDFLSILKYTWFIKYQIYIYTGEKMKKSYEAKRILVKNIKDSRENLLIRKKKLHDYDLHWHDCFEIELILSGTAVQSLNGITQTLGPGDIYLLNPTDFHSVKSNGAEVFNIMFSETLLDDELLQKILNVEKNILFHLDAKEFVNAVSLISQMVDEFDHSTGYSETYIKNLLECLFIILLRKYDFEFSGSTDKNISGIRKAVLFMHSHFRENPSMATAAEVAGFNMNYFSSLFHKITGKTYKEYLTELKLEYSKKLVLSGQLSISEICYASGFNSLPNFLKSFKLRFGVSPGNMRKTHTLQSNPPES